MVAAVYGVGIALMVAAVYFVPRPAETLHVKGRVLEVPTSRTTRRRLLGEEIVKVEVVEGHLQIHTMEQVFGVDARGNDPSSVERVRDEIRRLITPEEDDHEARARKRAMANVQRLAHGHEDRGKR